MSYCVVGAVISEWLGGYNGLGVYMTRVRKSYAFDKMFAVNFSDFCNQSAFDVACVNTSEEMYALGRTKRRIK